MPHRLRTVKTLPGPNFTSNNASRFLRISDVTPLTEAPPLSARTVRSIVLMYRVDTSARYIDSAQGTARALGEGGARLSRRSGILEFAVLGLLRESPMHGYELRKRLNTSLGIFRAFSYGTLYPCLKTLVANGWLIEEPGDCSGRDGARLRPARRSCLVPGGTSRQDRLPVDGRGQGALRGAALANRPPRLLGGRALRGSLRLLRADGARGADAGAGRPSQPAGGAPGEDERLSGPHPRAPRRLHT